MSKIQSKLTNIIKHSKLVIGINFTLILIILAIEKMQNKHKTCVYPE